VTAVRCITVGAPNSIRGRELRENVVLRLGVLDSRVGAAGSASRGGGAKNRPGDRRVDVRHLGGRGAWVRPSQNCKAVIRGEMEQILADAGGRGRFFASSKDRRGTDVAEPRSPVEIIGTATYERPVSGTTFVRRRPAGTDPSTLAWLFSNTSGTNWADPRGAMLLAPKPDGDEPVAAPRRISMRPDEDCSSGPRCADVTWFGSLTFPRYVACAAPGR